MPYTQGGLGEGGHKQVCAKIDSMGQKNCPSPSPTRGSNPGPSGENSIALTAVMVVLDYYFQNKDIVWTLLWLGRWEFHCSNRCYGCIWYFQNKNIVWTLLWLVWNLNLNLTWWWAVLCSCYLLPCTLLRVLLLVKGHNAVFLYIQGSYGPWGSVKVSEF